MKFTPLDSAYPYAHLRIFDLDEDLTFLELRDSDVVDDSDFWPTSLLKLRSAWTNQYALERPS
jgi:hypothetical protein